MYKKNKTDKKNAQPSSFQNLIVKHFPVCRYETSDTPHIILHSRYHPPSDSPAMPTIPQEVTKHRELPLAERILIPSFVQPSG